MAHNVVRIKVVRMTGLRAVWMRSRRVAVDKPAPIARGRPNSKPAVAAADKAATPANVMRQPSRLIVMGTGDCAALEAWRGVIQLL
jgi:hypothetical protein